MTDFEALGYRTGELNLPGLDVIVQLGPDQYFRDDGIVSDLGAHAQSIYHQLCGFSYQGEIPPAYGIHLPTNIGEKKFSTIFIRDIDPITNLLVLGHEVTHALKFLSLEHYLIQALRAERFSIDPFKKYDNEETIADIGGLLALHKVNKIHHVKDPRLNHLLLDSRFGPLVDDLLSSYQ